MNYYYWSNALQVIIVCTVVGCGTDWTLLFAAIGTGRSKKQAKHKAAKGLLDKLSGETPVDSTTNGSPAETM